MTSGDAGPGEIAHSLAASGAPDSSILISLLSVALSSPDGPTRLTRIISREPVHRGTSLKEHVTVARADGSIEDFLVKYAFEGYRKEDHRRGLDWEVLIYRELLAGMTLNIPVLHGTALESGGRLLAAFQWIPGAVPISWKPGGLTAAAEWLGRFHGEFQPGRASLASLPHLATPPIRKWIDAALAEPDLGIECRRVLEKCAGRIRDALDEALVESPALIHGEFYAENILFRENEAWVVDWESATLGFPEIDVSSLLENWSEAERAAALQTYARFRWGSEHSLPSAFTRRLSLAGIYWTLRWLAQRIRWLHNSEGESHDETVPSKETRLQWQRVIEDTLTSQVSRLAQ